MKRYAATVVLGLLVAGLVVSPATAGPADPTCVARTVVVSDAVRIEGTTGSRPRLTFTVTATGCAVGSVGFATAYAGQPAATPGADYTTAAGTLTWGSGAAAEQVVEVEIIGDRTVEADERLALVLTAPTGLTVLDASGVGTIINDDMTVVLEHNDSEPDCMQGGACGVWIVVSPKAYTAVTVHWHTANGTATGGVDFVPVPAGTTIVPPGLTRKKITVGLLPGGAGTFHITIVGASPGTVADPTLTVTIPSA